MGIKWDYHIKNYSQRASPSSRTKTSRLTIFPFVCELSLKLRVQPMLCMVLSKPYNSNSFHLPPCRQVALLGDRRKAVVLPGPPLLTQPAREAQKRREAKAKAKTG